MNTPHENAYFVYEHFQLDRFSSIWLSLLHVELPLKIGIGQCILKHFVYSSLIPSLVGGSDHCQGTDSVWKYIYSIYR